MKEGLGIISSKSEDLDKSERLHLLSEKMLIVFHKLKEQKIKAGKIENDAEIFFINKMINEFEKDIQKQRS